MECFKIFFTILASILILNADAMKKRKEIEPAEEEIQSEEETLPQETVQAPAAKKSKFDVSAFEKLPRDIQILTLLTIIKTSKNVNEAVKTIHNLLATNKNFYKLINSDDVNQQLIETLADRFLHGNGLQAADLLHTNASLQWAQIVLPENIRKRVLKIIDNGLSSNVHENLEQTIKTIPVYMNLNPSAKKILHNEYAMIWLLRTLLRTLNIFFVEKNDKYTNATELAALIYPNEPIESPRANGWISYADKQINLQQNEELSDFERLPSSEAISKLKAMISHGFDILDPLTTDFPSYQGYEDPQILQLFIDAGASLNDQNSSGNTILHHEMWRIYRYSKYLKPNEQEKYLKLIEFLLQSGANPNIKNNQGNTVLDILNNDFYNAPDIIKKFYPNNDLYKAVETIEKFYNRIVKLLKQYGAK